MRRLLIAALCLAPLAAAAQERPVLRLVQPDPTRTMLNLSESAEIAVNIGRCLPRSIKRLRICTVRRKATRSMPAARPVSNATRP